jgi:hypothetical protein
MSDADDLAESLRRYDEVVGEYVDVHQRLHDELPTVRPRRRWALLFMVVVLVLTVPAAMYVGRAHFVPAPSWPNSATTGVPAGTSLTAYTGPCTITTNNTVINAKTISGCEVNDGSLVIEASNVQITNSQVNMRIWLDTDPAASPGWSVSLTDSDVIVSRVDNLAAVCCGNYTITRSELQGSDYSAQCEMGTVGGNHGSTCTIRDSYLHGQNTDPAQDWHAGGFISEGGPNVVTIDHNYIVCDVPTNPVGGGCTGDLNLLAWFGQMQDATITNNFFGQTGFTPRNPAAGPSSEYCIYGGPVAPNPTTLRVKFRNNVFEKGVSGLCGNSGPVASWDPTGTGNEWIGNVYDDGTPVPELI